MFFLISLIIGFRKKSNNLKLISLLFFLVCISTAGWAAVRFISKSYNKFAESLKPRSGLEIYDALFGKRQTDCVKVVNYQDQTVPVIDYAIWLKLETCPAEMSRILSMHPYTSSRFSTAPNNVPYADALPWFTPATLGDSIIIFKYATDDGRHIQTIWSNADSTAAFIRDMYS